MSHQPHLYRGSNIVVTYDAQRCVHTGACLRNLPEVFDNSRRRWVTPDAATADQVAEAITRCPSGALQFQRLDDGSPELIPDKNMIFVQTNGPLYVRGDVELTTSNGKLNLRDTRVALCRCGASENKPFCDNAHLGIRFRATGYVSTEETTVQAAEPGPLKITAQNNGPLHVEGPVEICNVDGSLAQRQEETWLCRCGGSQTKPFCDGTHKRIGFTDSEEISA